MKPEKPAATAAAQPELPRTGTQSIERVVGMLRVVASRGRRGMRIAEVASTSGLPTSTCFRMLQRLELEGLVVRDALTRKYFLGPLLYELGQLAEPGYRLADLCDAAMSALAEQTQDTVYLSERRGLEAICTHRVLGDYPIKALTLDIGIRRPLGVGAGGLAMLAAMPEDEAEALIEANAHRYARFARFDAGFLRAEVQATRERGHSFLDSAVTPGTAAVGVAFAAAPGERPIGAISVAAISSRLTEPRLAEVVRQMQQQLRQISARLAAQASRPAAGAARR
ncbi:IclR family transcriptional regulator [Ideonella sp. DXS22W]|uniref:IclR family transcriptional regulator n=1 Tax=Pseudaquabacterium inlustre TaxID=2984192 RepID=A0ABU9CGK7_9BURK